jgi:hypothetical protein
MCRQITMLLLGRQQPSFLAGALTRHSSIRLSYLLYQEHTYEKWRPCQSPDKIYPEELKLCCSDYI